MAHDHHSHNHSHHHSDGAKNIKIAFVLNFIFAIFEIVGGLYINSLAIVSDALHDFGDSVSLGIAWFLHNKSKKGVDEKFSFGYKRFSLLGALINGLILLVGSIFILLEAVPRILKPEESNPTGMLLFAFVGIAVNGIAVLRLKKGTSLNEKVVAWHLIEDILGWVAILIVSIVLMFYKAYYLDPLLSIVITIFVIFNVFKNLKSTFSIILQGVPENFNIDAIEKKILTINNVEEVHHTHLWSMDGEYSIFSVHLVVKDEIQIKDLISIKREVRDLLRNENINHLTIEFEFENEDCYMEKDEI